MRPEPSTPSLTDEPSPGGPVVAPRERRSAWVVFAWGIGVRLLGLLLIWAGDGHHSIFSKVVVCLGVVLSIGGIGVLKWLSMQPRRERRAAVVAALPADAPVQ